MAVPHRPAPRPSPVTRHGRTSGGAIVGHERLGLLHDARRRARHPLHAAVIPGRQLLGRRLSGRESLRATPSWPSMPRPASTDGTSRRCITISGTSTCRRRPRSSTSPRAAGASPHSPRQTGYMFILDCVTGKPIFGVEERPVPKGTVPDEWYSLRSRSRLSRGVPLRAWSSTRSATWCGPRISRPQHVAECRRWGQERRLPNLPSPLALSRGRCATAELGAVSRRGRRRQLVGPAGGSALGDGVHQRARQLSRRVDRAQETWPELRAQHRRLHAAGLPRYPVNGAGPYFGFTAPLKTKTAGPWGTCRAGVRDGHPWLP